MLRGQSVITELQSVASARGRALTSNPIAYLSSIKRGALIGRLEDSCTRVLPDTRLNILADWSALMRRIIPLVACLILVVWAVQAQNAGGTLPRLTNKEVLEMVKAGLSSEVIIAKIKVSRCNFNTEASVLAELKHQGTPNDVLWK